VATNLNKGRSELDRAMQVLPIKLEKIGRTAIYGSFFNFYLCQFQGNVILPGTGPVKSRSVEIKYPDGGLKIAERCNLS
jgi:phospholipid/cholesterol/gamma-HCH transport system substrate-binding protein